MIEAAIEEWDFFELKEAVKIYNYRSGSQTYTTTVAKF
jgi:hypothetical protein